MPFIHFLYLVSQNCPEARIILFRTRVRSQFDIGVLNSPDALAPPNGTQDLVNSKVPQLVSNCKIGFGLIHVFILNVLSIP
jgi:hypothetical protein